MSGALVKKDPLSKAPSSPPGLVRGAALAIMLLCVGLFITGVISWFSYAPNHPEAFTYFSLTAAEMERLFGRINITYAAWINFQLVTGLIDTASYCIVGALIFIRKKQDWFGLFLSVVLVLFGTITSDQISILWDQAPWIGVILQPLNQITWTCWFIIFYLFPNGQFVPRWMRWFAISMLCGFAIGILFNGDGTIPTWVIVIILPGVVMALVSQIYRYRRVTDPQERQQIKWILFAILLLGTFLLIGMLAVIFPELTDVDGPTALFPLIFVIISSLIPPIFPLTIGLAILRYRLWDIDIIIRRTLQYSVLTGLLALVYFGAVTILQSLFSAFTAQQSPAALVLSTLAIAALFTPMRRRVQEFIDRRFYRRKYDGEKALAEFAAVARSETDLGLLSRRLTSTVQDSLQPEAITLWLRPFSHPDSRREA